jgi:hypothetical protein
MAVENIVWYHPAHCWSRNSISKFMHSQGYHINNLVKAMKKQKEKH